MSEQTVFDFIRDSNKQLSDIREDIGVLKAHAEQQTALGERVEANETRLGSVESDVKVWRRVFLGLWLLIAAAGTWAISWFK